METNASLPSRFISLENLNNVKTVEPYLDEGTILIRQLKSSLHQPVNLRLRRAFTALAGGDEAIGLLAFYLWRRRGRLHK